MSRHHFDVATWKIVGKKEISCNVLRSTPEEKEWKAKGCRDITMRSRHEIESYDDKETTNTIATTESKSQHEVIIQTTRWSHAKNDVATQKLKE